MGLRSTFPHNMLGKVTSTAYTALPVIFSTLPTLGTELPIMVCRFMGPWSLNGSNLSDHLSLNTHSQPQQTRYQANFRSQRDHDDSNKRCAFVKVLSQKMKFARGQEST